MKKKILLFFLVLTTCVFSQTTENFSPIHSDTIFYNKTIDYTQKREFKSDLKTKYFGKDFTYKEENEDTKEEIKEIQQKSSNSGFLKSFIFFMKSIFPFVLGGIVVFIILKLYVGFDTSFFKFKPTQINTTQTLVYEDEDIHNADLESLLKKAINEKDNRLSIRYYYLLALKKLSEKELIKYDNDKTNSEYLFEIKDTHTRSYFSYLSYIYTYVWYGNFSLNDTDFSKVEEKYKLFFKQIN
ncbi:hypothetical protein [Tenacibaculum sp. IB213877]|uniref:hypothetical protein n=1 Tax=Tenacibaculum sp. IB213877 TaxID=3097351 RepID=UPI002A5A1100|nr:hypothetical protein [Tenacibaculum sp. IB213877]MDY0779641.1 hypothetical protein [Tenacibaculum sp. IB213877]